MELSRKKRSKFALLNDTFAKIRVFKAALTARKLAGKSGSVFRNTNSATSYQDWGLFLKFHHICKDQ